MIKSLQGRMGWMVVVPMLLVGLCLHSCQSGAPDLPAKVDFNYHIKPILSDRCFACHGPDDNTREAGLALHEQAGLFAQLDSSGDRRLIVAGKPMQSELYLRLISEDADYVMPPPASNLTITEQEQRLIEKWIKQGAPWQDHWSFIPPRKPEPPSGAPDKIVANDIDRFVWKALDQAGMDMAGPEDPGKLLRRLSFDLTGLPPSPEALDAFLQDPGDEAYEAMVDQLLASPRYGERMASIWLDLARYADSHGYQDDRPRTMWPWRDWVVKAFNENLSYEDFVTWQLAGDLLPEATYDQKLATAFNRNHPITQEGGVINEEYLNEYSADRVQTFSTSFLGLTMECARCHDHKYDPIDQEEFYELQAFFNNVEGERGQISYFDEAPVPHIQMEDADHAAHIEAVKAAIERLEEEEQKLSLQPEEYFTPWQQEFVPGNLEIPGNSSIAHYRLDDTMGWTFGDAVTSREARVNVNLPPRIPRPAKVTGRTGFALEFDGDNFLTMGEIGDFDYYHEFSLGATIRHQGQHRKTAGLLSRRNGEQYRQGYDLSILPDHRISFRLIHNMYHTYLQVATQTSVPARQWMQIMATYDGSGKAGGVRIYFDGIAQPLTIMRDSLANRSILNGNDLIAGHWNHRARELSDLYGFKGGRIDDIRIFAEELSPPEVRLLHEGTIQQVANRDLHRHYLLNHSVRYAEVRQQLDSLRSIDISVPYISIMEERDTVAPAFLLDRGQYDAPIRQVSRNTPDAVMEFAGDFPADRLGLAQWLFDPDHPLTTRVMVNRLWQQCFGRGLVATPEDFGNQGNLPSHPMLLDWLAVTFKEQDWDIKAMLKLIVMSHTYRQSAAMDAQSYRKDPQNTFLARGPYKPLTAEMVRDQALATSGLLNPMMGGKWVKPYQPPGIWKEMANQIGENKYRPGRGKDLYRRSLYTYWKRTIPPPTMLTFDAPERTLCSVKRQSTSTPLQALILMNDPTYMEAAKVLAVRLQQDFVDLPDLISEAFVRILTRLPLEKELREIEALYEEMLSAYQGQPEAVLDLLDAGAYKLANQEQTAETAALTMIMSTIYNLDEAKYQ